MKLRHSFFCGLLGVATFAFGQAYQDAFEHARSLLKEQRFAEALEQARQAVHLDSTRWEGWFVEGTAAVGLEKYDLAIDYFQEALSRAPEPAKATVSAAIASCRQAIASRSAAPNTAAAPSPHPSPAAANPPPLSTAAAPRASVPAGTWLTCDSKSLKNDGTEGKCLQYGQLFALNADGSATGITPKGNVWTYSSPGRWSVNGDHVSIELSLETDIGGGPQILTLTGVWTGARFESVQSVARYGKGFSKQSGPAPLMLLHIDQGAVQRCMPLGHERTLYGFENQKSFNQCMSGAVGR